MAPQFIFVIITSKICGKCQMLEARIGNNPSQLDKIRSWIKPYVQQDKVVQFPTLQVAAEYSFLNQAMSHFPSFFIFEVNTWESKTLKNYSLFKEPTQDMQSFQKWASQTVNQMKRLNNQSSQSQSTQPISEKKSENRTENKPIQPNWPNKPVNESVNVNKPKHLPTTGSIQKRVITLLE